MSERDEEVMDAIAGKRPNSKGWVRAQCPFCPLRHGSDDKRRSLGVNTQSGDWKCHRCGARGFAQSLLLDAEGEPLPTTKAAPAPKPVEREPMELPEGFVPLYTGPWAKGLQTQEARDYLARRGLPPETGRDLGIGCVLTGKLRDRVVVPITWPDGVLGGWSARLYAPAPDYVPKYMYPSGMNRSELMFNAKALQLPTSCAAFLVEGVFDALALWPHAVACLGKPSPAQVDQLVAARRPVVVALDGDAWLEGRALGIRLRAAGGRGGWIRMLPGHDPGAYPGEVQQLAQALGVEVA